MTLAWRHVSKIIYTTRNEQASPGNVLGDSSGAAACAGSPCGSDQVAKIILDDCSGFVMKGQLVALEGPSGSSKTTLLNVLGNRNLNGVTGEVFFNGALVTDRLTKQIGFVNQDQIDLPSPFLTVLLHLEFIATLRSVSDADLKEKIKRVPKLIKTLHLDHVQYEPIILLSGGERKRLAVASEMVFDPILLLIDEATSGLDSSSAVALIKMCSRISIDKPVLISIHQPSKEMSSYFDKVMVLESGNVIFFDQVSKCSSFCNILTNQRARRPSVDFSRMKCTSNIHSNNIKEDMKEDLKEDMKEDMRKDMKEELEEGYYSDMSDESSSVSAAVSLVELFSKCEVFKEVTPDIRKGWPGKEEKETKETKETKECKASSSLFLREAYADSNSNSNSNSNCKNDGNSYSDSNSKCDTYTHGDVTEDGKDGDEISGVDLLLILLFQNRKYSEEQLDGTKVSVDFKALCIDYYNRAYRGNVLDIIEELISTPSSLTRNSNSNSRDSYTKIQKSSFLRPFCALLCRCFLIQRSSRLSYISWAQNLFIGLIIGLLWFQTSTNLESTVFRISSFLFFNLAYWVFNSAIGATSEVLAVRSYIGRELEGRSYGKTTYFLASVCCASICRLILIIPTFTLSYLLAIKDADASTGTTLLLLYVITSSSADGIARCFAYMSLVPESTLALVTIAALVCMLLGGFYIPRLPHFLTWLAYLSPFTYLFDATMQVMYDGQNRNNALICDSNGSFIISCSSSNSNSTSLDSYSTNLNVLRKTVPQEVKHHEFDIFSVEVNVVISIFLGVLYYILAYILFILVPPFKSRK